jgi:hypothetical protein
MNIRQRSLDAIPFSSVLRFDMEMWHWTKAKINFTPVSFWYLKPGGNCYMKKDSVSIKHKVVLKREDLISPWIINNRIEGENLVLKNFPNGDFWFQNNTNFGWSNNTQLIWTSGSKNDELDLEFYSEIEGFFQIIFVFTTGKKYGTFRISLNQEPIIDSLNLNNESTAIKKLELGKIYLKKGVNQLKIKTMMDLDSQNENAFGLDFISFTEQID